MFSLYGNQYVVEQLRVFPVIWDTMPALRWRHTRCLEWECLYCGSNSIEIFSYDFFMTVMMLPACLYTICSVGVFVGFLWFVSLRLCREFLVDFYVLFTHVFHDRILLVMLFTNSGFATDCPCGVWCRGLTTCLLYVGPLFGNRLLKNSWAVGLT